MIHELRPHPLTPARNVLAVRVEWTATDDDDVLLTFTIEGIDAVLLQDASTPLRTNGLWQTTCFELFWKPDGAETYYEFNLSPSSCWASYAFDGYRAGMRDLPLPVPPLIERLATGIAADVDLSAIPAGPAAIGLSAVIEEVDGTKSYWALAHPPGAPDFHHPDCFALRIPAVA